MAMQLDHEQLHRLLEALGESDIQEFRLEGDDFRLEIRRNLPGQTVMAPVMPAPVAAAAPAKPDAPAEKKDDDPFGLGGDDAPEPEPAETEDPFGL